MKKILNPIMLSAFILLVGLTGCEDFLENENKANLTDQTIWANEANADIYLNDIYTNLVSPYKETEQLGYYTDDYNISHYYTASQWRVGVCNVPATSTGGPWHGTHGPTMGYAWHDVYKKLRKCNAFLAKLEENKGNFSEEFYKKRKDEASFIRAYIYSVAFMHYGGLPLITKPLDRSTMSQEELRVARSSFEDTFNFIIAELDAIITNNNLQVKYNNGNSNAGRATIGAAMALKGWLQLFAASPLFNSGSSYLADPQNMVHFATASPARYATAAATFKKFIDTYGNGQPYGLFNDLANLWRESNEYNNEVIWDRQHIAGAPWLGNDYERRGGPTYVLGQYMCWGNYNPTQELVDQFCMANGKEITDPTSGYDPQKPYVGREKRFYDFIVFDGATYKLDWMPKADVIYTRIDQTYSNPDRTNQIDLAGKTDVGDSGYYQKKKLNPDAAPASDASGQNFIFYRYAEILLGYAEAQNEAVGPNASVYSAVNQVRQRAGIPDLKAGLSKEEMRKAIRRERRVELCFEDKRYWDNKRWKIAEDVMNKQRHNMVIRNSKPADNSGVWVYSVEEEKKWKAKFNLKQYMNPIPQNAIDQNPKLVQNPGY
ncbi:RagB/SusD family nutrient uptake outer membrane protein [Prolixibacteraceae bacterium JC049]|nr:RagB/SusD family nutrient uptake outer membrane protein [Prolixibacteraceae bacterium JC049]